MKLGAGARSAFIIAVAGAVAVVPVAAKEPLRLAPSSNWHVNYAPDSCRLARSFGTGEDGIAFVLDRFQPGPKVQLILSGGPVEVRGKTRKAVIRFGPNEPEQERTFTVGKMDGGLPAIIVNEAILVAGDDAAAEEPVGEQDGKVDRGARTSVPPDIDPARNAAVTSMEIRVQGKPPIVLETGAMDKPMAALATCADDLLRGWNVDVEAHRTLSRPATPVGDPFQWLARDATLDKAGGWYAGNVYFRLIVDADGKPASCHIQQSTRPVEFDEAVCAAIMARARFEPALDAAGEPIMSYYLNRVRFRVRDPLAPT